MDDVPLEWHRTCSHLQSGECGKDCAWCRFSVPSDEPMGLESDWARCRCYDDRPMKYGNPCNDPDCFQDKTRCGSACEFCNMSWPADDVDKWFSEEAACRCVPKDKGEIEFGNHNCKQNNQGICGDSCNDCRWSWPAKDSAKGLSVKAMCRCADGIDIDQ